MTKKVKEVIDNQIVKQTRAMRKQSEKYTSDFTRKQKEYQTAEKLADKVYAAYVHYFE